MNGSNFRVDFAVLQTFAFVKFLQIYKYWLSTTCADVITFYVNEVKRQHFYRTSIMVIGR